MSNIIKKGIVAPLAFALYGELFEMSSRFFMRSIYNHYSFWLDSFHIIRYCLVLTSLIVVLYMCLANKPKENTPNLFLFLDKKTPKWLRLIMFFLCIMSIVYEVCQIYSCFMDSLDLITLIINVVKSLTIVFALIVILKMFFPLRKS